MFVRKGQALGSILWKDAPKAERPAPAKKTKKAEPKPEQTQSEQPEQQSSEPPKHYAAKPDWVDYAVSKGADRDTAEDLTKEELIEQYG